MAISALDTDSYQNLTAHRESRPAWHNCNNRLTLLRICRQTSTDHAAVLPPGPVACRANPGGTHLCRITWNHQTFLSMKAVTAVMRQARPEPVRSRLLAAALPGFFKPVEQAAGVDSRECVEAVRLAFLDGVARDGAFGAKEFRFLFHLAVPHVLVLFADVHEDAHLRDRLKPGGVGLPHVAGKGGDGEEVLRVGGRDVKRGDTAV